MPYSPTSYVQNPCLSSLEERLRFLIRTRHAYEDGTPKGPLGKRYARHLIRNHITALRAGHEAKTLCYS